MEPQTSPICKHFIGKSYEIALDQALQTLLNSSQNSNAEKISTFSELSQCKISSTFSELSQCKISPPLESIWVHSALVFQNRNSSKNQFAAVQDLFQLIASQSVTCSSSTSILLMSPVIYHVHKFASELKGSELKSKKERKLMKEIRELVDSILAFISTCSDGLESGVDGEEESLIRPLIDLVSLWISAEMERGEEEGLELFFPLLGNEAIEKISNGSCGVCELAGYVIAEAFLLKCCLAVSGESLGKELQDELRTWVVGSVTGLRSSYFFDSLLRVLLGPSLPVASLLIPDQEMRLREVLYEAVTLVEYSFLNPERMAHLPDVHAKSIALGRLIVTHEAMVFFRKHKNLSKALACTNAFSNSSLPSQLIHCVKGEVGMNGDVSEPNGSSPKAFLRWILDIENRGILVFDDDMSAYRAKLVTDQLEDDSKLLANRQKNKPDTEVLFFIDNTGENAGEDKDGVDRDESMAEVEAVNASFVNAAHLLQSSESGGKKRKSGKGGKKNRLKFHKYNLCEDSAEKSKSVAADNVMSSGSDVDNPTSDEDDK